MPCARPGQREKPVERSARGGGEFGQLAGEVAGEIDSMAFFLAKLGVTEAETGRGVRDGKAATGGAILAVKRSRTDFGGIGIHVSSILGRVGIHPGCFRKSGK
jgi:hypothetical protein